MPVLREKNYPPIADEMSQFCAKFGPFPEEGTAAVNTATNKSHKKRRILLTLKACPTPAEKA